MDTYPDVPKVSYAECRAQIQSGDLLLCSGSGPVSRMIRAATSSVFSHVAFILRMDRFDRVLLLESVESVGARAYPLRLYTMDYNGTDKPYPGRLFVARHRAVHFSDDIHFRVFSQAAIDMLGTQYPTKEVLEIIARIVAVKLGMPFALPGEEALARRLRTMICSVFAQELLRPMGAMIASNPASYTTPDDFAESDEVQFLFEITTEEP